MRYKLALNMKSGDETLKCAEVYLNRWKIIFMIPHFASVIETLKCNHSNEICGVVLLFVFSQSEEVSLRLRNKLNFNLISKE